MKLRLTFEGIEIPAFCLIVKEASNVTHTEPATRKAMTELAERIQYAVSSQAPQYSPLLADMGDF